MFILKLFFYFFVSFVILCVPVSNRPLFDHAYKFMKPTTTKIINYIHKNIEIGLSHGEKVFKKIFAMEEDSVKSNLSALQKSHSRKTFNDKKLSDESPMGSYTREEKLLLEKIIRSAKKP